MATALGITIIWALLFVPVGVAFQWLVLGESARRDALQVAPVTGMAIGLVLLAVLRQAGVALASPGAQWGMVGLSIACAVGIWRADVRWRSRDLGISAAIVILAALVLQMPVWNGVDATGPTGWGTKFAPAAQVAAIDALVTDDTGTGAFSRAAAAQADDRYSGFETVTAFTAGLGASHKGGRITMKDGWSPLSLFGLIQVVLLALTTLPLLAFARWRGVGWLGRTVLVVVGVISPVAMLAVGLAQAAEVAAVPFATLLVFAVLVGRRDRGWYAVACAAAAAVLVLLGPLALLPTVVIAAIWIATRSATREHMAASDQPVTADRPLLGGGLLVLLALFVALDELRRGSGLPVQAMHGSLGAALTSWPFAWIEADLRASAPVDLLSTTLWFVGPLLLAATAAYGARRREMRELAIIAGVAVTMAIATFVGEVFHHRSAAIQLIEVTWVLAAPLLAAVCVRTAGLARSAATEQPTRAGRVAGGIAALLMGAFVLFSASTAAVSGGRMRQVPPTLGFTTDAGRPTLLLAADPWLRYFDSSTVTVATGGDDVDRHVAPDGTIDATDSGRALTRVLATSDPLGSDAPGGFTESQLNSPFAVREFVDTSDPVPTGAAAREKVATNVALAARGEAARAVDAHGPRSGHPYAHYSAESLAPAAATDGGLLVPGLALADCRAALGTLPGGLCGTPTGGGKHPPSTVAAPVRIGDCSDEAVKFAHSDSRLRSHPAGNLGVYDQPGSATKASVTAAAATVSAGSGGGGGGAAAVDAVAGLSSGTRRGAGAAAGAIDGSSTATTTTPAAGAGTATAPATAGATGVAVGFDAAPMLGVACFSVPIHVGAGSLRIHLRDVGYILTADKADRGQAHASSDGLSVVSSPRSGVVPRTTARRFETTQRGGSVVYGGDIGALQGTFDLNIEGSFPGGIDVGTPTADSGSVITGSLRSHVLPSYGPWSARLKDIPVAGGIELFNDDGTELHFGTIVARPSNFNLDRSCDVFLPIQSRVAVESVYQGTSGPGIRAAIVSVDGTGANRRASLAFSNYLQGAGYAHQQLVDYVEEYAGAEPPPSTCAPSITTDPNGSTGDGGSATGGTTSTDGATGTATTPASTATGGTPSS